MIFLSLETSCSMKVSFLLQKLIILTSRSIHNLLLLPFLNPIFLTILILILSTKILTPTIPSPFPFLPHLLEIIQPQLLHLFPLSNHLTLLLKLIFGPLHQLHRFVALITRILALLTLLTMSVMLLPVIISLLQHPPTNLLQRYLILFVTLLRLSSSYSLFLMSVSSEHEPTTYPEAATKPCWQEAMNAEIDALLSNHTWDIVPTPPNVRPIGCK